MFFYDIEHPALIFPATQKRLSSMVDDRFDGAVVERIGDIFAVARLVHQVVDHHVDQDVLSVVDFLFLDTDERAQPRFLMRITRRRVD